MTAALFALAGVIAGSTQAFLLARRAGGGPDAFSFLGRYLLVAVVLVLSALAGHILPAAAGWGLGFTVSAVVAYRRLG